MSKVDLKVDFCNQEAARYAVEHWHYSKSLPFAGKMVKLGVWEDGVFKGSVLFSWGANKNIGSPYGLKQTEVCELVRVALSSHKSPVSQIVSLAVKKLRQQSSGLRLLVSYADPEQGHTGAIYQAMNWIYEGLTESTTLYFVKGRWVHRRMASSALGSIKGLAGRRLPDKHKYLYPLDRAMRKQIASLAKPYPKREDMRLTNGSTSPPREGWQFDSDQGALTSRDPIRASG